MRAGACVQIVGSTFRPIMDALLISREKLAFLVDATSAPIASIAPISSWVGACTPPPPPSSPTLPLPSYPAHLVAPA